MRKRLMCVLAASLVLAGAGPAWAGAVPEGTATVPVVAPDSPNLAGLGQLGLTILSTAKVDATQIDPGSVTLKGGGIGIARWIGGQPLTVVTDANSDGRADLRLFFDKQAMRDAGVLSAATTELSVSGLLPDGRTITGSDKVTPNVVLEIKFQENLGVRANNLSAVQGLLRRHDAVQLDPLLPEQTLAAISGAAVAGAPDMASWYHLTLPAKANVDKVLADLTASPEVAYAYPAPEAAPPPATPDFTSMQGYFRPAAQGIDADFSRRDSRARGTGMRVVDLEYNWNPFHEDIGLTWASDLGGTQFPRYTGFNDEHGTAVFGEVVARDNGFGVTGGVPNAAMFGISPIQRLSSGGTSYRPAASLTFLSTILTRGDTVLIEQQTVGPNGGTRYVPLEWIQSVFDAFRVLTNLGVVVVETGANGGENLDAAIFQGRFNRSVRDSGAIIVGAGTSTTPHSRLSFSSYGSRVDVQGWGQNITTTGSNGNLQGGTDPANINIRYTRSFGGTSGAGPIVTSAVVAIQSYLRATGRSPMTASQMSSLLKSTGTPQGGDTSQRIGPLPNLRAALTAVA
ncbi:MAG TPA: S8 family serine peptidase [Candidatus Limnocylindrales bacterium]|nr:S8 family serine peptidase [Candidatus Limnocylindrales bacterium]